MLEEAKNVEISLFDVVYCIGTHVERNASGDEFPTHDKQGVGNTSPNNQMLELPSKPTPVGSQPLFGDEICDQVLGRRPGYSKGLGWEPKRKAFKTTSANSSMTSCSQSATEREIQIQVKCDQALEQIELQDRNYQALALEMEQMRKMIQDMTRTQQRPPHDP
ncbi:uncharacterized protein E5676_scaffold1415G00020 [Cucumis melo var. makuwa]|uniref:CACTA en-spm transposon protein n=1 Tax=Cucumis melo var. makuwa TaxID=1194695 RepID=A0A5A7VC25_CUCMM|nr:uncharacterized protein E6C27_scaffold616G001520 [Cucumis melo var. makuwa]TYK05150.1 uncharacterized protein E5676_scaffold1415G00020 [Cucumis melo var. makuwa]